MMKDDVFCVGVSLDCNLGEVEYSRRIQLGLFVIDVTMNNKTKLFFPVTTCR